MSILDKFVHRVYYELLPVKIKMKLRSIYYRRESNRFIRYWERRIQDGLVDNLHVKELQQVIRFCQKRDVRLIPYEWIDKYYRKPIQVYHDLEGYPYVMYHGKRLFFKKNLADWEVKSYFYAIQIEQDKKSPHCYLNSKSRIPDKNDIIADIGAAEGIFTLDVIERVKKAYLFECDEEWIEPLRRTFDGYMEKIEIIEKYVSDITNEVSVTLDDFFKDRDITYIKADIEGAEYKMLMGGG